MACLRVDEKAADTALAMGAVDCPLYVCTGSQLSSVCVYLKEQEDDLLCRALTHLQLLACIPHTAQARGQSATTPSLHRPAWWMCVYVVVGTTHWSIGRVYVVRGLPYCSRNQTLESQDMDGAPRKAAAVKGRHN